MYISLFSVLHLLLFGAFALSSSATLPNLVGGVEHGIDPMEQIDLIADFAAKGVNLFRIPIIWQTLVKNNPASISFDANVFARYDRLVQEALAIGPGVHVMIDLHDSGTWKTKPSDQDFANLWFNIAEFYASDDRVIFGITNKPHLVDISSWIVRLQGAVNSIRAAGATNQYITLPGILKSGRSWFHGTNDALLGLIDPVARTISDKSKLTIDVHLKVDSGNCSIDQMRRLAHWLEGNGRRASVSEIVGEDVGNCDHISFIGQDDNFVAFALLTRYSNSKDLAFQRQRDELFKQFVQPNLLSPFNPTRTRKLKSKARNRRQDTPSSTPAPGINRQTYTGDLGEQATPVYDYNAQYRVDDLIFPRLLDALGQSCAFQRTACLDAAIKWGNLEPLTEKGCAIDQFQACLRNAIAFHESIGNSAPANVQTFAATAGGTATSVYPILDEWVTKGVPYTDRVGALQASCEFQNDSCLKVATIDTCSAQENACSLTAAGSKSKIRDGYSLTGCMAESSDAERALNAAVLMSDEMTQEKCVDWCAQQGFPLAGLEYGRECYCDTIIRGTASNTTLLPESRCNLPCAYNPNEMCGGLAALTLYNNPDMYPIARLPDGWREYETGCFTEATAARALTGYAFAAGDMTPQKCINECQSRGFIYTGVEYSSECFCGNGFSAGSVPVPETECAMLCSGDVTRLCGGPDRLSTWAYDSNFVPSVERRRSLRFDRYDN